MYCNAFEELPEKGIAMTCNIREEIDVIMPK
jgi:hypothetical protein